MAFISFFSLSLNSLRTVNYWSLIWIWILISILMCVSFFQFLLFASRSSISNSNNNDNDCSWNKKANEPHFPFLYAVWLITVVSMQFLFRSFVISIHLNDAIQNKSKGTHQTSKQEKTQVSMPCRMMCFCWRNKLYLFFFFATFVVISLFYANGDNFDINWAVSFDIRKKPMLSQWGLFL